ncbi:MAG: mechanosensitive ion channel domain-containing protein [Maribacter dokdonensis]|uniref:Mechanosensitive ion channel n=1 Tax=Maribacter dokdonensis TaxID=320912 RepID=A0A1H4RL62_9FLAO|nr:mechanosensitive ion channel domain-containing protein [Maribacter dokdonensis]MBU2901848.1 mechanosensitive ion channel family protein [Maribacter dokdonensis]MDP2527365.1 mechanosensitive ion channel [Maribacter dokdonensis]SDS55782.1 Mechanosensitive ion channel [Maribacter dokdonensis]SEC32391.1 Mechanosensitive ion channel [Maribacter dokdonensis]
MKEFINEHYNELIYSLIVLLVILILKFLFTTAVRKVSKISDFNPVRTNLIIKFINIALTIIAIVALTFVWSVNYQDLGVMLSSVFAVIGVALFAQWSILSNITAGVIIFFSFPFKIGNTIRILDKELLDPDNADLDKFVIEDIRAFHLHLRRSNGEILTYPNNLVLQKGVILISTYQQGEFLNMEEEEEQII